MVCPTGRGALPELPRARSRPQLANATVSGKKAQNRNTPRSRVQQRLKAPRVFDDIGVADVLPGMQVPAARPAELQFVVLGQVEAWPEPELLQIVFLAGIDAACQTVADHHLDRARSEE